MKVIVGTSLQLGGDPVAHARERFGRSEERTVEVVGEDGAVPRPERFDILLLSSWAILDGKHGEGGATNRRKPEKMIKREKKKGATCQETKSRGRKEGAICQETKSRGR